MRVRKNKRRIDPRYFLHEKADIRAFGVDPPEEAPETEATETETTEPETTEPETTEPEVPEVETAPPEEGEPGRNERQRQKHREGKELLDHAPQYRDYKEFYKDLERAGLTDKLGRAGQDRIWGKKHQQAWEALALSKVPKRMTDPTQREAFVTAWKTYNSKDGISEGSKQFEELARTSGNKKAHFFAGMSAQHAGENERAIGLYEELLERDDLTTNQRRAVQKRLAKLNPASTYVNPDTGEVEKFDFAAKTYVPTGLDQAGAPIKAPIEASAAAAGEEITPETLRQGAAAVAKQKRDARIAKRSDRHRRRVAKQTGRDPVTGEKARVVDTANTQLFLMTKGQKGRVEPPKIVLPGEPEYDDARDAEPGDPTYQEKETGGVTLEPSTHDSLATDYEGRRILVGAPEEEPIPAANLGDVALAGELSQGGSARAVDEAVEIHLEKIRGGKAFRHPVDRLPEFRDAAGNEYRGTKETGFMRINRNEDGSYKSNLPVQLTDDEIAGFTKVPPLDEVGMLKHLGKQQLDKVSEVGIRALVSAQKNGSKHAGAILNGMRSGLRDRERKLDKDIRAIQKGAKRITRLKKILRLERNLENPDPKVIKETEEQLRDYGTRLYWRKQNVKGTQAKVGRLRKMLTLGEAAELFTPSDREALEKATAEEEMHSPEAARARTEKKWAEGEAADRARADEEERRKAAGYEREVERRQPPVRQKRPRMDESLNRNTRNIKIRINKRRRK